MTIEGGQIFKDISSEEERGRVSKDASLPGEGS